MAEKRGEDKPAKSRQSAGRNRTADSAMDERVRTAAAAWGLASVDVGLLRHALTHSSAVGARSSDSNERLEFLGDSILNAVVAEYLFNKYPEYTEGDLAKGRALVVSKLSLYAAGVRLGLPDLVKVGTNAEGMFARSRRSMTADAVEAVIAAVYLQFGWESAREFTLRILAQELTEMRQRADLRDAKTILQERAQAKRLPGPAYRTIAEEGAPHNRTFICEVTVSGGVSATGVGRSKKDAQQEAASAALEMLDSA